MASDVPHPEPVQAYDPNDPEQVERRQIEAARDEMEKRQAIGRLLLDAAGRKWMWDLLVQCHVFHTEFHGENTHMTAFAIGERNIGLRILSEMNAAAPNAYAAMLQEFGR